MSYTKNCDKTEVKSCDKPEVKKCVNECCKEVDVEIIKNLLSTLNPNGYLYEIVIKNNTNCTIKNVSLIDTFLVENSFMVTSTFTSETLQPQNISLLSNTATLRRQGNITDPCNTCLPPCSISRIFIAVAPNYNIGNYYPPNIITLHGYIGDKCIKKCCNGCNKNNVKPIFNTNYVLSEYNPSGVEE